jgi:hypothetical protein
LTITEQFGIGSRILGTRRPLRSAAGSDEGRSFLPASGGLNRLAAASRLAIPSRLDRVAPDLVAGAALERDPRGLGEYAGGSAA